jgi:hypothetical protein
LLAGAAVDLDQAVTVDLNEIDIVRALGSVLIVGPETKEPADLAAPEPEIPATATMKLDARTVLISSLAKDSILLTRQLDTSLARYARQEERQPSEA